MFNHFIKFTCQAAAVFALSLAAMSCGTMPIPSISTAPAVPHQPQPSVETKLAKEDGDTPLSGDFESAKTAETDGSQVASRKRSSSSEKGGNEVALSDDNRNPREKSVKSGAAEKDNAAPASPAKPPETTATGDETVKQALLEPVQPLFEEHQTRTEPEAEQEIQYRPLSAAEYVQNAIAFLNVGLVDRAKAELEEALALEPANRTARKLMQQITLSPAEYFKEAEYFEYVMRPDDSLSTVAEKFLKDPLKFHMLAKYNNLDNPAGVMPGKILIIPGERPEKLKRAQQHTAAQQARSSKPAETSEMKKDPKLELAQQHLDRGEYKKAIDLLDLYSRKSNNPKARDLLVLSYTSYANILVEKANLLEAQTVLEKAVGVQPENKVLREQLRKIKDKRKAERLYRAGLEQHLAGNDDDAFRAFRKALELNPKHMLARKQLTQIKPDLIETYHKKAMQLYRKQELKKAIKIWNDVLQIDPQHELAKLYRARAIELKRRIEQL